MVTFCTSRAQPVSARTLPTSRSVFLLLTSARHDKPNISQSTCSSSATACRPPAGNTTPRCSTLISLRPRLSSGWLWTMLCNAADARARASLLPRELPSNRESLSLPCSSWMSSGRQPD
ncbi:hypothetical protein EYF80_040818 [Liparis tanakae]|uniref:Uncharacterized protein n=1 Tax=Liparis tanakae TaxID=230148 RepID=A0A4Z2G6X1_9TELE|nr:hypothetical protein EYF80_040818 [Liparis tanakae]